MTLFVDIQKRLGDFQLNVQFEAEQERLENQTFVEGHQLDTDQLILQELILRVPEKVLCKEDCKRL